MNRTLNGICAVMLTLVTAGMLSPASNAYAAGGNERKLVERALDDMGIPVGDVDGEYDNETRRGTCVWRELTGSTPRFSLPTGNEELLIASEIISLNPSSDMREGLNVNITCQSATWIVESANTQTIRKIFPVTTGGPSTPTRTGTHTLYRETNSWHESTDYPGSMMYRPKYFSRGQALHGSRSDSFLTTNPDTYGCVRMLQADMDLLWKSNFSIGKKIHIYGEWAAWNR